MQFCHFLLHPYHLLFQLQVLLPQTHYFLLLEGVSILSLFLDLIEGGLHGMVGRDMLGAADQLPNLADVGGGVEGAVAHLLSDGPQGGEAVADGVH